MVCASSCCRAMLSRDIGSACHQWVHSVHAAFAAPFPAPRACDPHHQRQALQSPFPQCAASPWTMGIAHEVVIALGSNQGPSGHILRNALRTLRQRGVRVLRQSALYETDPKHIVEQPPFLNAAVLAETDHAPAALLAVLKGIESDAGRDFAAQRFGPRPLDLDIIFYGSESLQNEQLQVPHPRWKERPFVLAPVADLHRQLQAAAPPNVAGAAGSSLQHGPPSSTTTAAVGPAIAEAASVWSALKSSTPGAASEVRRILHVRQQRWLLGTRSFCMGILNVTPDSFSDGSHYLSQDAAVRHALQMADAGADIIDVGGQSTRPGAAMLSPQEEAARVLPVVEALRSQRGLDHLPLSIDTFHSQVAAAAVERGVDLVNDVSGGLLDPSMHSTVAALGVPYVLMHTRGTPATMQAPEHTRYADVAADVAAELAAAATRAVAAGIPAWDLILDPGIGFAKGLEGNVELIRRLGEMRGALERVVGPVAWLVGPSRKGFLGRLTGRAVAGERDAATVAAAVACVAQGADVVRAHNVAMVWDGLRVADAVYR